jgi:hypothetical protein
MFRYLLSIKLDAASGSEKNLDVNLNLEQNYYGKLLY